MILFYSLLLLVINFTLNRIANAFNDISIEIFTIDLKTLLWKLACVLLWPFNSLFNIIKQLEREKSVRVFSHSCLDWPEISNTIGGKYLQRTFVRLQSKEFKCLLKNTLPLLDHFIYMCQCASKNEVPVYNNSCYSYQMRCKQVAGYSAVKPMFCSLNNPCNHLTPQH